MLDITVKTMDSQSRSFQVPESMTVGDFKRRISDSVNIPVGSQRLIFQGRVLSDTMKLTSDHHEKTLHLVQRAQPTTSNTPASTSASGTTAGNGAGAGSRPTPGPTPGPNPHLMPTLDILNQMFTGHGMFASAPVLSGRVHQSAGAGADGSMNIEINLEDPRSFSQAPAAAPSGSNHQHARRAADSRVNFERMWRILQQLQNIADNHAVSEASDARPTVTMEGASGGAGGESAAATSASTTRLTPSNEGNSGGPTPLSGSQSQTNLTSSASRTAVSRLRQPLVSELRDFYAQFTQVQERLQPIFNQYQRFLQTDPAFTSTNSREYQDATRFFQLAPQTLRHMADVYDFLANISIPLERVPPRPVMVVNSNRARRSNSGSRPGTSGMTHVGQLVRGQQGIPSPSGTSAPRNPNASGRRRFCVHQTSRSGGAGSSSSSRRPPRPTTSGSADQQSDQPQSSSSSGQQQRNLPPYAFQINAHVHPRVTVTFRPNDQQQPATTAAATTTAAPTTAASGGNPQASTFNQTQQQGNVSRMNFTWNGTNLLPSPNMPANGAGISLDAIRNLVTSATQGSNQAGVVVVDTANVNNVGEDISRAITDTLYSTLSSYLGQAYSSGTGGNNETAAAAPTPPPRANVPPPNPRAARPTNNMATIDETGETQPSSNVEITVQPIDGGILPNVETIIPLGDSLMLLARDVIDTTGSSAMTSSLARSSPAGAYLAGYDVAFPTDWNHAKDTIEAILVELVNIVSVEELSVWYQTGEFPFRRVADVIRQILIEQMFQGKAPESSDDVKEGMKRISAQLRRWLAEFFADTSSTGSDCDVIGSNFYFLSRYLQTFIKTLFLKSDSATFVADMSKLLNFGLATFCHLNYFCLEGGSGRLRRLIIDYFRRDNQQIQEGLFQAVFNTILPPIPATSECVSQYYRSSQDGGDEDVGDIDITGLQQTSQESASTSKKEESGGASAPSSTDDNSSKVATTSSHVSNTSSGDDNREEEDKKKWRMSVPAEWVKTIESDMKIQDRLQQQAAFSDAYLVGMPANKRRKTQS